jgi:hypothetical protein
MDDLWMCCGGGSSDGLRSNGVSLRGSVGIQTKALLGGRCSGVRTSNKNGEMMLAVKTELASAMSGDGDVIGVTLLKAFSLFFKHVLDGEGKRWSDVSSTAMMIVLAAWHRGVASMDVHYGLA